MRCLLSCSGAQGEYTGLRAIKAYLESNDQKQRSVSTGKSVGKVRSLSEETGEKSPHTLFSNAGGQMAKL